jgi:hypothetical protein
MSEGPGRRHRSHWIKPYLKAEMVYGLQVLLFIVQEVNSGTMSKKEAEKIQEVKFAGDLTGNHLFAVGVLRGLIVNHQFLKEPIVALTLCNAVRKRLLSLVVVPYVRMLSAQ